MNLKLILTSSLLIFLFGCVSGNCRHQQEVAGTIPVTKPEAQMSKADSQADRVRVYKYDGTLQCNQGKAISLEEMQKELSPIKVFSATNKQDGLMHIMVCGSITGRANVFEIDRSQLAEAVKKGFKEWTFE